MKLVTIDGREVTGRPGVLLENGEILDLAAAPKSLSESQWIPHSIVSVLAAGASGLEHVEQMVRSAQQSLATGDTDARDRGAILPYATTELMAPIRRPGLVLNVDQHGGTYLKSPNAAVGNNVTVRIPVSMLDRLTGGGALAVVMGRELFRADEQAAEAAIAGFTLMIDLSLPLPETNAPMSEWRAYWASKQFPGACPIGPAIITKEEVGDINVLTGATLINDVEVANGPIFGRDLNLAAVVAELSRTYAFRPGDLIGFDAWSGDPGFQRSLREGDKLTFALKGQIELNVQIG
jgi:2-keto-4-pentenoate hydratase/2-oxohepta-3-ene-1,7-dioic acid hydratase in catechol pathway